MFNLFWGVATFGMKSGVAVEVLCDSINIEKDGANLIAFEVVDMRPDKTQNLMFLSIKDIEFIHWREPLIEPLRLRGNASKL